MGVRVGSPSRLRRRLRWHCCCGRRSLDVLLEQAPLAQRAEGGSPLLRLVLNPSLEAVVVERVPTGKNARMLLARNILAREGLEADGTLALSQKLQRDSRQAREHGLQLCQASWVSW